MNEKDKEPVDGDEPKLYKIRIQGHLEPRWASWFEDLSITRLDSGETLLTGPVVDQAALHGLLKKVRDLGLPLLSVIQLDSTAQNEQDANTGTNHSRPSTL